MNQDMMNKFLGFVCERELVRLRKEDGRPKPWTDDKVLQTYRFCNINRNDDTVSRWIYEKWIRPHEYHPNLPSGLTSTILICPGPYCCLA